MTKTIELNPLQESWLIGLLKHEVIGNPEYSEPFYEVARSILQELESNE